MIERDLSVFTMYRGWFAPFYNRQVNDLFDDRFSGNGYYPNDDDYTTEAIVNLKVFLDDNRRVSGMSCYKMYDLSPGHGRPVNREEELNRSDIKKLVKALEECTISTAEEELERLLQKASVVALPGGWRLQKTTKKAIVFENKKGEGISISKGIITNAIDISHGYIDIINCKEFWDANPQYLKNEYAAPIMALLSLVDITQYYDYETLQVKAQSRLESSEEKARIEEILKASKTGDIKIVKNELKHIRKNPIHQYEMCLALYSTLERKDEAMARLLISQGIDLNQTIVFDCKTHGIMEYVVRSELDSVLQLCLNRGFIPDSGMNDKLVRIAYEIGRQDYAIKLLKNGALFVVGKDDVDKIGIDVLSGLTMFIPNVKLTYDVLPLFYKAGKKTIVKRAITKPSAIKDHETHGYVRVLLDIGDIDLMQLYCDQNYPGVPSFPYFHLTNTKCFSHPWTKFYTVGLFKDQRAIDIFVSHGFDACIENHDAKGLIYLFDEMHAKPKKEQIEELVSVIQDGGIKDAHKLVKYMLENIHFANDNVVYLGAEVSEEEMRKFRIRECAAFALLVSVLEGDNSEHVKMAIENQRDLIVEPGAFCGVYNAAKESKHKELRDKIFKMIEPAARTIVDTWGKPNHFVFTYQLDEVIEKAKELLKEVVSE